jgi:hypothetical protein
MIYFSFYLDFSKKLKKIVKINKHRNKPKFTKTGGKIEIEKTILKKKIIPKRTTKI